MRGPKCGTVLRFPPNKSNNLLFMLTESSLKKDNNNNSHLISSINGISAYNSILNRCIFNRDNFSLNPAQCELLKWHSQWCHCDLNQVRMILSKPRQPKNSVKTGELIPQMVSPSVIGTTTCIPCCCEACQYENKSKEILRLQRKLRTSNLKEY